MTTYAVIMVLTFVTGVAAERFWLRQNGSIPRFWPNRIRRHCYDKPHRCPGWAGGGWKWYQGQRICKDGSIEHYSQRAWRWRFHRCDECGTIAIPYVTRWLDPAWWGFVIEYRWWRYGVLEWWQERHDRH